MKRKRFGLVQLLCGLSILSFMLLVCYAVLFTNDTPLALRIFDGIFFIPAVILYSFNFKKWSSR